MRWHHLAFTACFFGALAFPLADAALHIVPQVKLKGAVRETARAKLTLASYLSGDYQQAFEGWFTAQLAVRGHLVRTDNELNLRAFRQFNPSTNTALILGEHGFIYERDYVDAFNRRDLVPASELEQKVTRLKLLQDYLEQRGSTLLVVISPSKALTYPEYLPPRYVDTRWPDLPTNYARFRPLLQNSGVHFIDAQEQFSSGKAASPFPFFANSGAHWNDPAACDITSQIAAFVKQQSKTAMLDLRCTPVTMRSAPVGKDRDLSDLANLMFEERLFRPTPYSASHVVPTGHPIARPSVLLVGSSFVWAILGFLGEHRIVSPRTSFFYYYSSRVPLVGAGKPLDRAKLDWNADVFSRSAVVIEVNAAVVQHVGWGFLEDAERVIQAAH
jgi:alginate O-acetyltransferase complex protein AlgJ